ncbi:MAG: GAF domain-containing protein, partial [Ignavibacteria bacterium]|nr:GAF domain-containing protein [Ignavibacteria bacterium]
MNFLSKHTDGTLRLVFSFIAIYCLTISSIIFIQTMFTDRMTSDDCLWINEMDGKKLNEGMYIVQVLPGGVTDVAGIKNGDILIAINGIKFNSIFEAQGILNSFEDKETIEYTIIRNNEILKFNIEVIKIFNIIFLIFSLLGFGFLFIGFIVGYSKPKELTSQLFFFMGCTASLVFTQINFVDFNSFLPVFNFIAGSFFYVLFVHFIITYPIKIDFKYRKSLLNFLYIFVFVIAILRIIFYDKSITGFLNTIYSIIAVGCIAPGIYFLIRSYFRLNDNNLKKPMKIILIGFLLGGIGFTYSLFISIFVKTPNFLLQPWVFLPTALVLAIPVSFGFSIFKYRILDTEFIVKKGLVFGIITAFIVGIYLFLVFVLNSLLSQFLPENKQLVTIALIIIVTFSFDYVNKRAKDFVDKQFYRERYNYRKSLLLFSEELPYLDNVRKIIEKIGSSVKETMGIDNLNVWFKDQDFNEILQTEFEKVSDNEKIIYKDDLYDEAFTSLFIRNKEPRLINEVLLQELKINEEYKEIILKEKFALLIPIFIKDVLIGTMNFGEKPSGKAYSDEDIDLLKTLASQAAIAFENSRLQKEKVLKQVMEEELQIARNIQMGLLPQSINSIDGIEVSGFYNPAKIIGGDFYDVIKISENKLLVIVADVSGKGIPAALYMSKVQAMIQFAASIFQS